VWFTSHCRLSGSESTPTDHCSNGHEQMPSSADITARADMHRTGYLRGWRDVMGFAYLALGQPRV
jgi:hypothetical protein